MPIQLELGQTFPTILSARDAINRSVIDNGESYKIHTSNAGVHIIQCRDARNSSCNFYIRASLSKKTAVVSIVTLRSYHSCSPRVHYKFREASRVWYLAPHHRAAVSHNRIITTKQIIANERERYGNTISYSAAYRVRASLREEFDGKEEDNFRRMPGLYQRIFEADQQASQNLQYEDEDEDGNSTGRFVRWFIAPSATKKAWDQIRPFIAVDACHCYSFYRQTIMVAVGIDANNQIVPLCWAIVQTEDYDNWLWFLGHMRRAFELHDYTGLVIMSDREKGLEKAVQEALPQADHSHCAQHIASNVQAKFGLVCRGLFWSVAYARTEEAYNAAISELKKENKHAATYIQNIPAHTYSFWVFLRPRFGHFTSNIVESLNGAWQKSIRHLPPLRMMAEIWAYIMEHFAERMIRQQEDPIISNEAKKGYLRRYDDSRRWRVLASTELQVQVKDGEGREHVVDFETEDCTCNMWQEYLSPCAHAIVGSRSLGKDPYLLFDRAYTILNYRLTYQQGLPPVTIQDIPCSPDLLPPLVVRKRGRPRVRRMRRRERYQDGQRKCGNSWCRQLGHNTRTCDTAEDDESSGEEESDTESEEEFPELVEDAREAALTGRPSRAAIAAAEMRERRAQIQQEIEQARQVEIDEEAEFAAVFGVALDPPLVEARRSTRVRRAPKNRD